MQSTKTTIILTTAILFLTLLTAGCTDTGSANPETVKYTAPPEEVAVVEETAAEEPVSNPTVTHWYDDKPYYAPAVIDANDNFFGVEIEGIKHDQGDGWYKIIDYDNPQKDIFDKEIYTPRNLRLDLELSSDQYRTLIDQYGSMISVTMETIDLDQDGAMDKVAVKYVGSGSVLEFKMDYREGATIKNYLKMYIVYLS